MVLMIECVAACVIFAMVVVPTQFKDPVKYIMSYPPAIRARVESLPQYQKEIGQTEKRHVSVKIAAAALFAVILALVAYFSGARTFPAAWLHVFLLFFAVNAFDVIVLDIGMFCHSKRVRIPGTEDMEKEYTDPWFHVRGGLKGVGIGGIVALLAAGIVHLMSSI